MRHVPESALVEWIERCATDAREAPSVTVSAAHHDEYLLLHGLIVRTFRYSNAYLTLVKAGMEGEAVPLARAALEHAVTLQWVFVVDGGVTRYRNTVAHDRVDHFRSLAEWLDNDELREALCQLDPIPKGKQLGKFTDMMRDLDDKKFLQMSYRILSQHVHVTHSAVTAFLTEGEEGELHILYEQEYAYRSQATYVCAIACMMARWVLARLTNDEELLIELDQLSDELQLPMNLTDNVKPPLTRRTGI
ncbi:MULTISPECIES: DUF5677 domain-containing protein [unclassified Microbacterium]|uniref:DUF5677 domain-containing protein n=1 Tax=unclassified Microbacterium TaxID=2609290 RepID=UPI0012FA7259|nr:DUF5677 domain-containing protein [Microbacterium sp. MAH-37]MVQ44107.1 hypothetical protein [Microbacterium sp. MAH-37]